MEGLLELAALVSKAADGDRAAADELRARFDSRLRAYFRKHTVPRGQLEDAVQETFVRTLKALPETHIQPGKFGAWLVGIASRVRVDLIRQTTRSLRGHWRNLSDVPGPTVFDPIERAERVQAVDRAVRKLSPAMEEAVVLRHYHALSYKEIAKRLGISRSAVGSRLSRAKEILQKALADYR